MAEPVFSRKPNSQVPGSPATLQQIPSKSSSSLCKSLVVILVLVVIPLFPSQAPDFINQSVLSEFWEIVHLLFIGIAVSYGLFGRKSAHVEIGASSSSRLDGSNEHLSGVLNVPSIFENVGLDNLCGSDGKRVDYSHFGTCSQYMPNGHFIGEERCGLNGVEKTRSFVLQDGIDNVDEGSGKTVAQTWNSQYFQGESMVVVADGKYVFDENVEYKPLNLPIRRLSSRIVDNGRRELDNKSESSPSSEKRYRRSNDNGKIQKVRGMVPMNLEKKFEDVARPSSIPWCSRSSGMGMREKINDVEPPFHSRTHSIQESGVEHLKSRSLKDPPSSLSPERPRLEVEKVEIKKGLKRSTIAFSKPKVVPIDGEAVSLCSKTGPGSTSPSEVNVSRNSEYISSGGSDFTKEDMVGKGKQSIESPELDVKSSTLKQVLSRAKSVRTIRPYASLVDEVKNEKKSSNEKTEKMIWDIFDEDHLAKRDWIEEHEDPPISTGNQEFLDSCFEPDVAFTKYQNGGKQYSNASDGMESEEGAKSELDKSSEEEDSWSEFDKISAEEDSRKEFDKISEERDPGNNHEDDPELAGSEVDRKASEFIAKFREQIRLQKIESARKYNRR